MNKKIYKTILLIIMICIVGLVIFFVIVKEQEVKEVSNQNLVKEEILEIKKYRGYTIAMIECKYDNVIGKGKCKFKITSSDTDSLESAAQSNSTFGYFGENAELRMGFLMTGGCQCQSVYENNALYITMSFTARIWEDESHMHQVNLLDSEKIVCSFDLIRESQVYKVGTYMGNQVAVTDNGCRLENLLDSDVTELYFVMKDGKRYSVVKERLAEEEYSLGSSSSEGKYVATVLSKKKINLGNLDYIILNGEQVYLTESKLLK